MIRTAREPKRCGSGPGINDGKAQASQDAGQERKALLIGNLPAPHVRAARVDGLILDEALRKPRIHHILRLVDGVGIADVFVEETRSKQADRLQILLEEEVIVVRKRGFQIGIAKAAGVTSVKPWGLARNG